MSKEIKLKITEYQLHFLIGLVQKDRYVDTDSSEMKLAKNDIMTRLYSASCGSLMSLEQFTEECEDESLINYDGWGHFCDEMGDNEEEGCISPSEWLEGKLKTTKTHILWYNR